MKKILLLSNGHGEDLSGSIIGNEIRSFGHQVDAIPLVGTGSPYQEMGIKILIKGKDFSTGGLGYTTIRGRVREILEGQLIYLFKRIVYLLKVSNKYDFVVAIGDIIPIFSSWLCKRPSATYLVAYSAHYEGSLKLPWPCNQCLKSKAFKKIYARDDLTAEDLTKQLGRAVDFVGNPFMDALIVHQKRLPEADYRIGLLPGSRIPETEKNLLLILSVIELISEASLEGRTLKIDLALIQKIDDLRLAKLIQNTGWEIIINTREKTVNLMKKLHTITIRRRSFESTLKSSDLIISMAGTAAEQAVGLSKPVLQIAGEGPQFTANFAEAQRRLLGPTVFCAEGPTGTKKTLKTTAKMAIKLLKRIKTDKSFQNACKHQAQYRIGIEKGGQNIARSISDLLLD